MLRAYLRFALRTFRRHPRYTAVNAVGLTVGLVCCALVAVFLQHELSWDTHHDGADRIYRILSQYGTSEYSDIRFEGFRDDTDDAAEQRALTRRLVEAIPAVEQAANYVILDDEQYVETEDGDRFASDRQLVTTTGARFMDLFAFERVAGASLTEAFRDPGSAVLTETTTQRYFGSGANPVGQTVTVGSSTVTVRAVVADPPSNSRLQFDLALHLKRSPYWAAHHYLRLAEGTDPAVITPQVTAVMDEVDPSRRDDDRLQGERLQALTDVYLAPRKNFDRGPHRDVAYLWVFAAIGGLILVVTTINYANLALALYAERRAEIGVRKTLGGHREQIAGQFMAEAVVLALGCVPLALFGAAAVLPAFNGLMDTSIAATQVLQPAVLGIMAALALLTGCAAGGYPAFVLARKQSIELFDRGLSAGGRRGWSLRHGLIALQFVVLIGLGSLSWIAIDQLRFMQDDSLAYQTENVIRLPGASRDTAAYAQWRQRLLAAPSIAAVGMGPDPRPRRPTGTFALSGDPDRIYEGGQVQTVDVHWFDVMGIDHPVAEAMKRDGPGAPQRTLINKTAAALLDGVDPVGQRWIADPGGGNYTTPPIEGTLPDLYFHSMRQELAPTAYRIHATPPWSTSILVRFAPGRLQAGMDHVRTVWGDLRPDRPFQASFMSNLVADLYEQERRFTTLSGVLAGLAILLAAIGLASLVAYLTRLRRKEIGVRKALGGSVASIVALLNKEYVQIVGAAFFVGVLLAWWAARTWLGQFANQVGVSPLVFVGTGLGALAVAVLAVSTQALRAARVDPAQVLRSE
jgi:putative ABC transport system permease protein